MNLYIYNSTKCLWLSYALPVSSSRRGRVGSSSFGGSGGVSSCDQETSIMWVGQGIGSGRMGLGKSCISCLAGQFSRVFWALLWLYTALTPLLAVASMSAHYLCRGWLHKTCFLGTQSHWNTTDSNRWSLKKWCTCHACHWINAEFKSCYGLNLVLQESCWGSRWWLYLERSPWKRWLGLNGVIGGNLVSMTGTFINEGGGTRKTHNHQQAKRTLVKPNLLALLSWASSC